MCGRFVVASSAAQLVELFDVEHLGEAIPEPSFNVAPTDVVPIILDAVPKGAGDATAPVRRLEAAHWGLVPSWASDRSSAASAINARVETAAQKPTFATAVSARRAIIPASGYYEWSREGDRKVPRFIHLPNTAPIAFAGMYEWWRDESVSGRTSPWLLTTSILTRESTGALASVHDRMPVFLVPALLDDWLDPFTEGAEELLAEAAEKAIEVADHVEFHEVDPAVGNVRNSGASLVRPVASVLSSAAASDVPGGRDD